MTRWLKVPLDLYLDQRHPNWVLAEEFGDVKFSGEVVFVHRERAEHVARTLLGGREVLMLEAALALPARTPPQPLRLPAPPAAGPARESQSLAAETGTSRWRGIWGWFVFLAGAAMLLATLVVPFDDAGLMMAAALVMRGGLTILDADGDVR